MKAPKDLFSGQAGTYALFRPAYPEALLRDIAALAPHRDRCLDCATGNGQVAFALLPWFDTVFATDISPQQLAQAPAHPRIAYSIQRAEATDFPDGYFSLITVGQALHWFDLPAFYREARRLLRPRGIVAAWGYGLLRIDPSIDQVLDAFYRDAVGTFWEPERRLVEDRYRSLPFPWDEINPSTGYAIGRRLGLEELLGYLYSWSATRAAMQGGRDPVAMWRPRFTDAWGTAAVKEGYHPVFLRIGRKA